MLQRRSHPFKKVNQWEESSRGAPAREVPTADEQSKTECTVEAGPGTYRIRGAESGGGKEGDCCGGKRITGGGERN